MTATFGLLSALNIGSLRAADVKWHPGVQVRAGAPRTEIVTNGMHQLSSNGYAVNGYVLLGWSDQRKQVVMSQAAENNLSPFYRLGSSLDIQGNRTLYAVWALDKNGNGIPDYQEAANPLRLDTEYVNKLLSDLEAKRRAEEASGSRRNLRAAAVSLPKWNIKDDIAAYKEKVYFVGCTYNEDTTSTHEILEPLIAFYGNNSFPDRRSGAHNLTAARDMELVFNYGGVLEDTCLVGGRGRPQKALSRIPFPKPVAGDTLVVLDLFSRDPMTFTRIKEDGDAVLKLYFVKKKTGKGPDTLANSGAGNDTSYFRVKGPSSYPSISFDGQGKPFIDEETGEYVDTLTFRFQIFNQPEFAATTIRSRVSYGDTMRLNYGHLRGTPLKYMMRSLDGGWNWHPADSPLTDVERDLLQDDSVRVCLRQLDKSVGWAAYQKETFMDPERYTYQSFLDREGVTPEDIEWYDKYSRYTYFKEIYDKVAASYLPRNLRDTVIDYYDNTLGGNWAADYGGDITREIAYGFATVADFIFITDNTHQLYPHLVAAGYDTTVATTTEAVERRDINTVFGKRKADAVAVPERCRDESYCFYVKRDAPPVHQRSVFIPTVEGVTVVSPGVGYTSIPSQKNFTFRVKYTGEPMTVTAKRLIDGRVVEVLTGTLNADGEYEYVIRRVMQDLTLEFTKTVANTLVDQPSVWANSGAVRIHAPKETTVRIYSASGVLVKQATVQGDKTVPLAAGLYLVVLSDGTTQKVLVQ